MHLVDRELISTAYLRFDDLVTIRRGEPVVAPLADEPVAAQTEWIKIRGRAGGWCCCFFDDATSSCTIYNRRPLSCRALKCWDTKDILALAGRDLLSRFDLINSNDPLLPFVKLQELSCPLPDMFRIPSLLKEETERDELMQQLTRLVRADLQIRTHAASEYGISVERELFYFGRPLFQLLQPFGILTTETPQGIVLSCRLH